MSSYELVSKILLKHHAKRESPEPPYPEYFQTVNWREHVLAQFQSVFADPANISKDAFRSFLDFDHNHHWTGLQRPTKHVCDDMPTLRRALTYLVDETVAIAERIDALTGNGELSISGLSTGILTPILLIRYPDKYGVWNGKSEAAMQTLKIWPSFARGTSKGEQYRILSEIYVGLSQQIGLDLWTLDGLWHVVKVASKQEADSSFEQFKQQERDYYEGRLVAPLGYRIERNARARARCLDRKGYDCAVCGFNFFERYGEIGLNYIHVHHVDDLALAGGERRIDPKTGLVPVCPNCHAMLHKGVKKSRTLEDLRARLRDVT